MCFTWPPFVPHGLVHWKFTSGYAACFFLGKCPWKSEGEAFSGVLSLIAQEAGNCHKEARLSLNTWGYYFIGSWRVIPGCIPYQDSHLSPCSLSGYSRERGAHSPRPGWLTQFNMWNSALSTLTSLAHGPQAVRLLPSLCSNNTQHLSVPCGYVKLGRLPSQSLRREFGAVWREEAQSLTYNGKV